MSIICIEQEEDSQSSNQFQYERFLSYDENDANDISKMFMDLATHSSPSEPCPLLASSVQLSGSDSNLNRQEKKEKTTKNTVLDLIDAISKDRQEFILTSIPKRYRNYIRCRLVREALGAFLRTRLDVLRDDNDCPIPLLFAEKHMDTIPPSRYQISMITEKNKLFPCAELVSNNMTGTRYTLVDLTSDFRRPLAQIAYETNFIGFNGPRMVKAICLKLDHDNEYFMRDDEMNYYNATELNKNLLYLQNEVPFWNPALGCHALKFDGKYRPAVPSTKNFQMIMETNENESQIVLQFCRSKDDSFHADIRSPLSLLQAFALMLTALESHLCRK